MGVPLLAFFVSDSFLLANCWVYAFSSSCSFALLSLMGSPVPTEIFMKGHKIEEPSEISTKILSCDEKYCTLMFLESLSKFLPTPEQVRILEPPGKGRGGEGERGAIVYSRVVSVTLICSLLSSVLLSTPSSLFPFQLPSVLGRQTPSTQDRYRGRIDAPPRSRPTHGSTHQNSPVARPGSGHALSGEVRGESYLARGIGRSSSRGICRIARGC